MPTKINPTNDWFQHKRLSPCERNTFLIGADYTLSPIFTTAEPEMKDYTQPRWKRPAIKGKYRCDTFAYDAFRASTDLDNITVLPYRYVYNMDSSWRSKVAGLYTSITTTPSKIMQKNTGIMMKYSHKLVFTFIASLSVLGLGYVACDHLTEPEAKKWTPSNSASSQYFDANHLPQGVHPLATTDDAERRIASKVESLIRDLKTPSQNDADVESKIQTAQDLNKAYFASNSRELQKKISNTLSRALREEKNPEIASAIAFSHSRLFFDENTLPNLKNAYDRDILDFDGYYGELAHIYPGAPDEIREIIIHEISKSHNRYAAQIIANRLASEIDPALSSNEIADLQRFLAGNEPGFDGAADAIGYFDVFFYSDWLIASARLKNKADESSAEQFIANKLLLPTVDPRKTVTFLVSGYAENLTDAQKKEVQWEAIRARALEFMRQNPDASSLQQIGEKIKP